MKYYVVLDTNVVVSALFNISSVPGMILQEALAGRVIPLLHEDILDEYNEFCTALNLSLTAGTSKLR